MITFGIDHRGIRVPMILMIIVIYVARRIQILRTLLDVESQVSDFRKQRQTLLSKDFAAATLLSRQHICSARHNLLPLYALFPRLRPQHAEFVFQPLATGEYVLLLLSNAIFNARHRLHPNVILGALQVREAIPFLHRPTGKGPHAMETRVQ